MGKTPHVAIIGAGFSGLRCADILSQNNVQVTILEARDRVGGRVFQSKVGDYLVDLGPNWIHGTGDNPISTISNSTKTTVEDFNENQVIFSRDGKPLDDELATKASEFVWTTIDEAFEYSNTYKDSISPTWSLFDFFKEKVEKRTDFSTVEKEACLEYGKLWGSYVGDPVEKQSLKFFCLEECLDSNTPFVSSTYQRILKHVSEAALQRAEVRYNQPVVRIEAQPRKTNIEHHVTLSTADGQRHQFDEVVVTCPLGWLKRNKYAFTPDLPPRLTQAIDSISYGRLEKVYVTFPQAFWHSTPESNYNPLAFVFFLDPTYTNYPGTTPGIQECTSLASLPPPNNQPTLLFYTHGPCATHIVSNISNLPPSSPEYYTFLNTFLHPFYSRLPGYSATSPDCKPLAFLATQWQADPYAGNGSYSNFQVGLQEGDRDIEVLRDGAGMGVERGVWFAGEHTAPFVALGTTTGAYWSGERAAAQVCEVYGLGRVGVGSGRDDTLPSGRDDTLPSGRDDTLPSGRDDTLPSGRDDSLPSGRG